MSGTRNPAPGLGTRLEFGNLPCTRMRKAVTCESGNFAVNLPSDFPSYHHLSLKIISWQVYLTPSSYLDADGGRVWVQSSHTHQLCARISNFHCQTYTNKSHWRHTARTSHTNKKRNYLLIINLLHLSSERVSVVEFWCVFVLFWC